MASSASRHTARVAPAASSQARWRTPSTGASRVRASVTRATIHCGMGTLARLTTWPERSPVMSSLAPMGLPLLRQRS